MYIHELKTRAHSPTVTFIWAMHKPPIHINLCRRATKQSILRIAGGCLPFRLLFSHRQS